ncbi:hypothetical protein CIRMBP1197_01218 [Enterococcus cecorum]|nr:hypothetical protein CIRMBP1197_01218 [Enterococcus cecorum]
MYHTRYSYPFYIKFVRRVGQLRADKVVQNVGKVREVKTFPDELGLYAEVAARRAQIIKM